MAEAERSNTTNSNTKKPGGVTGHGFVKGDPRINRKGRPKSFDALRRLTLEIACEVISSDEKALSRVEQIMRSWSTSDDPAERKAFIEYAYGKVPQQNELTGAKGGAIEIKATDYRVAIGPLAPGADEAEPE